MRDVLCAETALQLLESPRRGPPISLIRLKPATSLARASVGEHWQAARLTRGSQDLRTHMRLALRPVLECKDMPLKSPRLEPRG